MTAVEKELRALNPTLRHILRSVQAEVDVDALLGSTGPLVPTPEVASPCIEQVNEPSPFSFRQP